MTLPKDACLLFGRLFLIALFGFSAVSKFGNLNGIAAAIESIGWPAPQTLAVLAAVGELAGALGVAAGLFTRTAAVGLIVYTVLATLGFHAFWAATDPAIEEQWFLHAMKNLGLIGGLICIAGVGPGRFSLDAWRDSARIGVAPSGADL